jgi:hypothetical protein
MDEPERTDDAQDHRRHQSCSDREMPPNEALVLTAPAARQHTAEALSGRPCDDLRVTPHW